MKKLLQSKVKYIVTLLFLLMGLHFIAGCKGESIPVSNKDHQASTITNKIAVPAAVRQNLGIDFAVVENREVKQTRRIPGVFEFKPEAIRDYHSSVPGHVELFVTQFQKVKKGDLLFRIDSPAWHVIQHELGEAINAISLSKAKVRVAMASYKEIEQSCAFLKKRVENLAKANVRRADLDAELLVSKKALARLDAELQAARADHKGALDHLSVMLKTASSTAGIPKKTLSKMVKGSSGKNMPYWQTVKMLDVKAKSGGIVDQLFLTNGSWVEQGGRVMKTVVPQALRFRAQAPQTDIQYYKNRQEVMIVPSQGASVNLQKTMKGTLVKGYNADSHQRTLPLYAFPKHLEDWAAPGVSAFMEVKIKGSDRPEMAIPLACIVRDGLDDIFFRRDKRNPDFVVRTKADLGVNDGRWVVLRSGVKAGDQIVMNGVYQLKLSGGGKAPTGPGHFHADGTWHAEDH